MLPIETTANADAAFAEAGSSNFPLLPKGWYEVTFVEGEIVDFTKNAESPNYGKKALNARFRIVENAPEGAKRVFFGRIPLFQRYAPNQKNPNGAVANDYFNFFLGAGQTEEAVKSGKVDMPAGGTRIAIRLGQEKHYKTGELENQVAGFRAPRDVAPGKTSSGTPNAFANGGGSGTFKPSSESPWAS